MRRNISDLSAFYSRLIYATYALLGVVAISTIGYHVLGQGRWSWLDCLYMTLITIGTIGYGETLDGMAQMPEVRLWTMGLIVFGSGALVYFVSNFTALIIEGDLRGVLRRNRMRRHISHLENHIIVCGVGTTGIHVVEEMLATQTPFVVVEMNTERLGRLIEEHGEERIPSIEGDATEDEVLEQAGVKRARGVVAALHEDKDNLFVTITARSLNPTARIVAKAVELSASTKLRKAGADAVVSPNYIGGMRMASEMIRPSVTQFLDLMLRDKDRNLRIEEVTIPARSELIGARLVETDIMTASDCLVIAIRRADGTHLYNPKPDTVLEREMCLIILAESAHVNRLRKGIQDGSIARSVPPGPA